MLPRAVLATCVLASALVAAPGASLPPGRPLPDVPLHVSLTGKMSFRQFRGKALVIVLISTRCAHCVELLPILKNLQAEFGPQGLQVIGAAGDENAAGELPAFLRLYRPTYPFGYFFKPEFIKMADLKPGVRPFVPIVMFVDRAGMIRMEYFGNDSPMARPEPLIRATAAELLKESPAIQPAKAKKAEAPKE